MSETIRFKTSGMHCQSCSMLIQMNLDDLDGVKSAKADYSTGITEVDYDPAKVTPEQIAEEIRAAGYEAERA